MPSRSLSLVAATAATLTTGCMGWWHVDADRPRRPLEELRDREPEHADACAGWSDLEEQSDEPDRYVAEVDALTDDMLEACADMMNAGRVDRDDDDDDDEVRGRLRIAVEDHRGRIEVVIDVDAVHGGGAEHHLEMLGLLDDTEATLVAGGMMGGGMM